MICAQFLFELRVEKNFPNNAKGKKYCDADRYFSPKKFELASSLAISEKRVKKVFATRRIFKLLNLPLVSLFAKFASLPPDVFLQIYAQ